jgi:hypothetical protein
MSGKAANEGPSAPGFHTTSPLHEKQRDTRALPGCYKIYPTLRISGAFVWFCNSLQTPGVEGFGPSCKSVLFKAASNQNLLFPHDMPSRTEAHTNSGQRPTNLACAGEGSAPLPRQGTAQPLPLGADERSEKCRTMLSPPVLPERHRAPQGVR